MLRPLLIGLAVVAPLWLVSLLLSQMLAPSPTPAPLSPLSLPDECALTLGQGLMEKGFSATVVFAPDATLQITVPYPPLAAGARPDEGAQAIWAAFEATVALPPLCSFHRLEVTVWSGDLRLQAAVTAEDLHAWAAGMLSDDALIESVTYTQETVASPAP